jgi:hypothetical protein
MTTAFGAYVLGFGSGATCDRYRKEIGAFASAQFVRAKNAIMLRLK